MLSDTGGSRTAGEPYERSEVPLHRPWLHEPTGLEGGVLSMSQMLFERSDLHLTLNKAIAYPQGVRLNLTIHVRELDDPAEWLDSQIRELRAPDQTSLAFSMRLPSGLTASTQDETRVTDSLPTSSSPSLVLIGGLIKGASFGDLSKQAELGYVLWMAPLPPAQSLDLTMHWLSMGVPHASAKLDGLSLRVASHDAHVT